MVVICPKCKTKLKVVAEKIAATGSRFKCPKCSTVLLVRKPVSPPTQHVDNLKVVVAHSNKDVSDRMVSLLRENGYEPIAAYDGIETMVKAVKERPFLAVVEVGLPKIYGFEVCKKLKQRPETKEMKFILLTSVYDKDRYKREPESLYGADDYIEEHAVGQLLIPAVRDLKGKGQFKESVGKTEAQPSEEKVEKEKVEKVSEPEKHETPVPSYQPSNDGIERARRLARTVVSDIYLYNTAKADEAIRNGAFSNVFATEIREGLKLYEGRIALEVRTKGDFFHEAINDFIANKRKVI